MNIWKKTPQRRKSEPRTVSSIFLMLQPASIVQKQRVSILTTDLKRAGESSSAILTIVPLEMFVQVFLSYYYLLSFFFVHLHSLSVPFNSFFFYFFLWCPPLLCVLSSTTRYALLTNLFLFSLLPVFSDIGLRMVTQTIRLLVIFEFYFNLLNGRIKVLQ